ncbi:hypothetical protein [Microbacterium tumbae]
MTGEHDADDTEASRFAAALRSAIADRGVTLAWLRSRLREHGNTVAMATLSYWRSGKRRPEGPQSLAAVHDIEELLGLEADSLAALIGPTQRVGVLPAAQVLYEEERLERAISESLIELGAAMPENLRELSSHMVVDVGEDGFLATRSIRSVLQAVSGSLTELPFLEVEPGGSPVPPVIRNVSGARTTRSYAHPLREVHGVVFELDHALTAARTAVIEFDVEFPPEYPRIREQTHGLFRSGRDQLIWVRFHPSALPDWFEEFEETPAGTTVTPRELDGSSSVHVIRPRFGPGVLGVRWGYGARD